MTVDKEYIRKVLNQYADVAVDINAIKQEIIAERELDDSEKLSWQEQNTIKTYLNFGCSRLLDEFVPREQK